MPHLINGEKRYQVLKSIYGKLAELITRISWKDIPKEKREELIVFVSQAENALSILENADEKAWENIMEMVKTLWPPSN